MASLVMLMDFSRLSILVVLQYAWRYIAPRLLRRIARLDSPPAVNLESINGSLEVMLLSRLSIPETKNDGDITK
jgi:hypothetical protein